MRTIHIMLLLLTGSLLVAAQETRQSLDEARQEVQKRTLKNAAEKLDPGLLKPYEITTKETVTRSPETGKVIFVNVNTYRGGTLIENHTKRDSQRTGDLDHFFQRFFVNGKPIGAINRFKGIATKLGNCLGVSGQAGVDIVFSDDNRDGNFESLLIMDVSEVEPRMIEAYKMGEDGFFLPASAEEYYRATGHLHTVAPVMSATLKAIEGVKTKAEEKDPNE